jgi:hypothetical protein
MLRLFPTWLALAAGLSTVADLCAADAPLQGSATTKRTPLDWNDPRWWERMSKDRRTILRIAEKDYTVSGPLVDTFRARPRRPADRNLAQQILDLPVINLFVPQPMPTAPKTGGAYFKWGDGEQPWFNTGDRHNNRPAGTLVRVGF